MGPAGRPVKVQVHAFASCKHFPSCRVPKPLEKGPAKKKDLHKIAVTVCINSTEQLEQPSVARSNPVMST